MAFLEVLTRCYKRPAMLAVNRASLAAQTDGDYVQTLLVDDVGRGIAWSHENMGAYAAQLTGAYVWVLDDDDTCICPTLVADLKAIARRYMPDVIMLRMDHGAGRVLPDARWGMSPIYGQIGVSAYVVRRQVWQHHAHAWTPGWYGSDFSFIDSIWRAGRWQFYWHDCIASAVQQQSFGKAEGE